MDYAQVPESAGPRQQGRPSRRDEWAAQRADLIPAWERERYAAYPSLATRMGLGDAGELLGRLTRIFAIIALIALVIALLIVAPRFFPAGIGGPTPSPTPGTPGPTLPPTPTPPPTPAPSPSPQLYTIQPGDTLFGIAGRHGITVDQLLAANPQITDPNLIQAGQVIVIPPPDFGLPTLPPAPTGDPSPAAE